jgi:hypothetical protein
MGKRSGKGQRWLRLLLLALATAFLVGLYQSWIRIPANLAPWGDIALDRPPSWLARVQINSVAADSAACIAALDRSQLRYRRTPARPITGGCGLEAAVRPLQSHLSYNHPFDVTCGVMAALYWYEAELQRLAQQHLGTSIARIDQLGTYACRNISNARTGRRSQHATANAIDIAGFRFADGRAASVLKDWGKDTPQGRFLEDARDAACRFFNVVLSPDYNALHASHFHLDLGGFRMCR